MEKEESNREIEPAETVIADCSVSSMEEEDADRNAQSPSEDIEAPTTSGLLVDDNDDIGLEAFQDSNSYVVLPLPGNDSSEKKIRHVPNGCSICLSRFKEDEKITWSSNKDCLHAFHHDCLLHWLLTVGRKVQQQRYKRNPTMTEEEVLENICKFPMLCPCCRQSFYPEKQEESPRQQQDESNQHDHS